MASKKFTKDTPEWGLFQDFWALCQKYWIPEKGENSKAYWEALIDDTDKLYDKYKDTDEVFIRLIMIAFLDTLNSVSYKK